MITRLRLKNWRSLRDVTIDDLQPINVFIGANASGKTNILDALYFIRDMITTDIIQAVYKRGGGEKIRTLGIGVNEPVEIESTSLFPKWSDPLTWNTRLTFSAKPYDFWIKRTLLADGKTVFSDLAEMPGRSDKELPPPRYIGSTDANDNYERLLWVLFQDYVMSRWQMLAENFMPAMHMSSSEIGNTFVVDRRAENLVFILDYMNQTRPEIYSQLQDDFRYLLGYIDKIRSERDERETRIVLHEVKYPDIEAPTVSSGTARILAMLTAYYALDLLAQNLPGLVVIEEPDTALNPGLLKNFVEQLREYVDRPEPRQFILTTHNPAFLNYFRPEEVRIVSRDEQGYTTVSRVPDYIKDIWLDEHGLGEVWLTNAFGGVAE